ncbi:DUF6867 family protein [Xanthobacter sp. AM11]|uniref:DUF6867 family protein n=1 Tax=Xanthobacter sp. AM11 TaxID=3380643 RepID=UPI0039BF07AE
MAPLANPGRSSSPMLILPVATLGALTLLCTLWPDLLIGGSLGDFLLVTLCLGGGAAWLTGKAVAGGWSPYSHLVLYCLPLTAAVRFGHFALFEDTLFAPEPAAVEFVLLLAIATLGFRTLRRRQMTVQYGWMYAPAGRFGWRRRGEGNG